jgi:cysteine desulfurase
MIYLDHAATTPVDPRVAAAMQPFLGEQFGNPSSIHALGRAARAAVDTARDTVASALNCDYAEICFTSSGTEADNLALIGVMLAAPKGRNHLVVSSIEHHAVSHAAKFLETQGYAVTFVKVDAEGFVDMEALAESMTERTALVSVVHGNNEIGTIQDITGIAKLAHDKGARFHTDAVQSFGSLPVDVKSLDCDLLSISAHKIYGPKGAGALYARIGVPLSPILVGGSQERERRAGTENTAGIVGFGGAVRLLQDMEGESSRLTALRDKFIANLFEAIPDIRLNGPVGPRRLPNNVNISIAGVDGSAVLMNLDRLGIAASSGSACSSGSIEPSHVLTAIGLPPDLAASGIRLTLGRSTREADLNETVGVLSNIVHRLRA